MKNIKAASVQFNHKLGDKKYNLGIIESFCRKAAKEDIKLIVFPEMCITGYWHVRNLDEAGIGALSESADSGPSVLKLKALAAELDMMIGAGIIEISSENEFFNTYVVVMPDGSIHSHRKLHCFINSIMRSGSEYTVFDTPYGFKAGILICWDNNLIENGRATALLGADLLIAPHQTGGCDSRSPDAMNLIHPELWHKRKDNPEAIEAEFKGPNGREWLLRWLPSRAHDNGMFVIFSNGVGVDDDEVRTGNAMILDCYGRIITETWKADDVMVSAELDFSMLYMCTGRRWIRGRRPELYSHLTKRFGNELDPGTARFADK